MVHGFIRRGAPSASASGFTLIELLVVTGIFVIVSGIVLANYGRFGGVVTLKNLAYEIALSIREAQIYGIAVRRTALVDFGAAYGVRFTIPEPGSPSVYDLFTDVDDDGIYDGGESVGETTLQGGYHITDLKVRAHGGLQGTEVAAPGNVLHIVFKRPEPDALIRAETAIPTYGYAEITIESPRGDQSRVIIELTGQISVK